MSCPAVDCGKGGILCAQCLFGVGDEEGWPRESTKKVFAHFRGEDVTPPPGFTWGEPQRWTEIAPLSAEEIAAADVGDQEAAAEWSALPYDMAELERRQQALELDQDHVSGAWLEVQADRKAVANDRRLGAALLAVNTLWTVRLLDLSGAPSQAVFLLSLLVFSALAWRFWGRAWVEGQQP